MPVREHSTKRHRACWFALWTGSIARDRLPYAEVAVPSLWQDLYGTGAGWRWRTKIRPYRRQHDRAVEVRKRVTVQPTPAAAGELRDSAGSLDPVGHCPCRRVVDGSGLRRTDPASSPRRSRLQRRYHGQDSGTDGTASKKHHQQTTRTIPIAPACLLRAWSPRVRAIGLRCSSADASMRARTCRMS